MANQEEQNGFDKASLKAGIDKIASNAAKSSYSRPEAVEKARREGHAMIDEYPRR